MDVGVGLNATIPRSRGADILAWARRADGGPFSSLGIIDRIAYPNHEPLITLAAVAGVTERIRLTTTVLVAPIRQCGLLAKQTASIDSLSGGRLSLGLGIGSREDDYVAADGRADFAGRAGRYEEQLDELRLIWRGQSPTSGVAPIGPEPVQEGGPELLLGGYSTLAARRAGEIGDGFIAGNLPPDEARELYEHALDAFRAAARQGHLRFVVCGYFCLGDDATIERGRDYLRNYYGFREGAAERAASSLLAGKDAIADRLDACEEYGLDEVILWPTVANLDQVDGLAEIVAGR